MLSALENTKYKKEGKTHVFYPPLGSLSLPCKLRFVTMLTVDIQVTSSQTLCGDETVPVRNQMASRYNNVMVEIKETDCQTIAQIESRIYHFFVCESFSIKYTTSFPKGWATPFWTTRSKWTEDTGRWLFHVGFKVKHLSIFCLHFSWSWRTTSEVLRSWPRVSATSNQSTQIGGKSLLLSFIGSESLLPHH